MKDKEQCLECSWFYECKNGFLNSPCALEDEAIEEDEE